MKKILFLFAFLCLAGSASAQGFRFSSQVIQKGTVSTATNAVVVPANPIISFCNAPANAVPCTNRAVTYTDSTLSTPCSSIMQIVLDGTNNCVASPDAQNNWGVWVPSGTQFTYTITVNGVSTGPYFVTSGGSGSIATGQIAVASGTNAIGGSANLTFDLISHRINQTIPTNADAFYAGNVANDPDFQVIYGANGTTPGNLGWSVQQTDDNYNTEAVLSTLPGGRILMEVLTKQPSTPDIQHVAVNPDGTVDIKVYTAHDLIFPLLSGAPNSLVRSNGADPQQMVWDTNCVSSASPAVCSAAPDGNVVIAASGTSVVVNTSAVTANSQIFVQEDQSLGTRLGVTCNTGFLAAPPVISARSAGVSFTIAISAGLAVNPVCFSYMVVN